MIGYGAMLMEGLVGVVALIAAASLDPKLYYDINVGQDTKTVEKWQPRIDQHGRRAGQRRRLRTCRSSGSDLGEVEEMVGGESAARPDRRGGDAGRRHGVHPHRRPALGRRPGDRRAA